MILNFCISFTELCHKQHEWLRETIFFVVFFNLKISIISVLLQLIMSLMCILRCFQYNLSLHHFVFSGVCPLANHFHYLLFNKSSHAYECFLWIKKMIIQSQETEFIQLFHCWKFTFKDSIAGVCYRSLCSSGAEWTLTLRDQHFL